MATYQRYRIEKRRALNIVPHPHPFKVKIRRWALLKHLLKELFVYKGNARVVKSNPCAYGVFSGPVGGFLPREKLCVGCLRCTTQYPEISTILPNPARQYIGDVFIKPDQVDMIIYEAERGDLAVKGAGYRGKFGGAGWDRIWTDMSEIVRPTRDGIYGREYISTEVHLGVRPPSLHFTKEGDLAGPIPRSCKLPFPVLFDTLPNAFFSHPSIAPILAQAARELNNLVILPLSLIKKFTLQGDHIIPLIEPEQWKVFKQMNYTPQLIELKGWDSDIFHEISSTFPHTLIIVRLPFEEDLISYYHAGVRLFHLTAGEEGYGKSGAYITDLIRKAHLSFVKLQCRDGVTLIGSGGVTAAEHVPKALLLGLDAVSISLPLLIALQVKLEGRGAYSLPKAADKNWGAQRIQNLMGAWQDQLFEFAGAMGIREVRRMRGEIGRALFQEELEREAFSYIPGYMK